LTINALYLFEDVKVLKEDIEKLRGLFQVGLINGTLVANARIPPFIERHRICKEVWWLLRLTQRKTL
jgi:predicted ABC-type sugar transport system permease subunit